MWFISDTHFGHTNVIKFSNRPYSSVEEMNECLINNWNDVVEESDHIYHLGDVSFVNGLNTNQILRRLKGQKHLIKGNHDKQVTANMWSSVHSYHEISYEKRKIVLCHYAMRVWNQSHYGSWMLHGHSHGSLEPQGLSVDVGVDSAWITGKPMYRPYHVSEIEEFMNKRDRSIVDNHKEKNK